MISSRRYLTSFASRIFNRLSSKQDGRKEEQSDGKESQFDDVRVIGEDYLGNFYYERDAGPTRVRRWYLPVEEDDWTKPIPPEWEAWLRYRRNNPPTYDEINTNIAIAQLKKIRAKELEEKEKLLQLSQGNSTALTKKDEDKSSTGELNKRVWPKYSDYHNP